MSEEGAAPYHPVIVQPDDELYRRVLGYYYIAQTGTIRSGAFKDKGRKPANRFSVYLARLTTPLQCLSSVTPNSRLIGLYARTPLDLGFRIWNEPEMGDTAHCNVEGESSNDICDQLARASYLVIVPMVEAP